jgi:hypothetical protein
MILLVPMAFAGWTPNGTDGGCSYFLGDVEGKVQPVRAECDWPVAADEVERALVDPGAHDGLFSSVKESTVLGPGPNGKTLVYQVHVASGISDREVVLLFGQEALPGGVRYTWTRSPDQSRATGQLVPVAMDTGKWEVTSTATGAHVVYELRYDAGGSVPGFVVRWFQGSGVRALVGELRKAVQ